MPKLTIKTRRKDLSRSTMESYLSRARSGEKKAKKELELQTKMASSMRQELSGLLVIHTAILSNVAAADHKLKCLSEAFHDDGARRHTFDELRAHTNAALSMLHGTTKPNGRFAIDSAIKATLHLERLFLAHPNCNPVRIRVVEDKIVAEPLSFEPAPEPTNGV